MKIKEGYKYQLRDGRVTGPIEKSSSPLDHGHPFYCKKLDLRFTAHGFFKGGSFRSPNDIVSLTKLEPAA